MTAIKERPILFTGEMVRAILDGRKTQTRRAIKQQPPHQPFQLAGEISRDWFVDNRDDRRPLPDVLGYWRKKCPYGQPYERLWVRETWGTVPMRKVGSCACRDDEIIFKASDCCLPYDDQYIGKWKPSIYMPRWASRILLEITDIRVERLNDISESDATEEGFYPVCHFHDEMDDQGQLQEVFDYTETPVEAVFAETWDRINEKRGFGWAENPLVWVVEFERIEA